MTQLAFDIEGLAPVPTRCADGGWTHRLAPCGHCERCGTSLLSITHELARGCRGH